MSKKKIKDQGSLANILDRVLERGLKAKTPSFRGLVEAANLDPARDFIGASLRNIDLRDEDLRGFDFSKADLTGADFRRANVKGAQFKKANLAGAIGLPPSITHHPHLLDVPAALSDLGILLKRLLGEKVDLEIIHGADIWPVLMDLNEFERMIVSVVTALRDNMPARGTVVIRSSNVASGKSKKILGRQPEGDHVQVVVEASGTRTTAKILAKILESSVRSSSGASSKKMEEILSSGADVVFHRKELNRTALLVSIFLQTNEAGVRFLFPRVVPEPV